jgi:hypothetical protein
MEVKTHLGVLISNLDTLDRDWMGASSMSEKFSKTMEVSEKATALASSL